MSQSFGDIPQAVMDPSGHRRQHSTFGINGSPAEELHILGDVVANRVPRTFVHLLLFDS